MKNVPNKIQSFLRPRMRTLQIGAVTSNIVRINLYQMLRLCIFAKILNQKRGSVYRFSIYLFANIDLNSLSKRSANCWRASPPNRSRFQIYVLIFIADINLCMDVFNSPRSRKKRSISSYSSQTQNILPVDLTDEFSLSQR